MLNNIIKIAKGAGSLIMSSYDDKIKVDIKKDKSPVTKADLAANDYIIRKLSKYSELPIVTEETPVPYNIRKEWKLFWIIDPLDGTKDFIEHNNEFTVNIALIKDSRPILGVIYAPALNQCWWAKKGMGAYKDNKKIFNNSKRKNIISSDSRFHSTKETLSFLKKNKINKVIKFGSSLKLCKLAEGKIDIYPRLNGTKEWDTAASDIILHESGCSMVNYITKKKLKYNKRVFQNPFFIAYRNGLKWK